MTVEPVESVDVVPVWRKRLIVGVVMLAVVLVGGWFVLGQSGAFDATVCQEGVLMMQDASTGGWRTATYEEAQADGVSEGCLELIYSG